MDVNPDVFNPQTDADRHSDLQEQGWEEGEALGVVGEAGPASSSLHFYSICTGHRALETDHTHTHTSILAMNNGKNDTHL